MCQHTPPDPSALALGAFLSPEEMDWYRQEASVPEPREGWWPETRVGEAYEVARLVHTSAEWVRYGGGR